MPRYIDADALIDNLTEWYCKECNKRKGYSGKFIYEIGGVPCRACEVDDVKAELEDAPTVDVPDRKVGKWVTSKLPITGAIENKCSECGTPFYMAFNLQMNYCPNCGCEMRKDE